MLYYLLPLAFFYLMFGVGSLSRRPEAFVVLGAIPVVLIALLRGNVGVDTPNYLGAIDLLRDEGQTLDLFEPLFEHILLWLGQLPIEAQAVLALVSLLTTIILLSAWIKLEPQLVIFTVVFAQFFVDMTMNGIRYGLAFSLVTLAAVMLVSRRKAWFWLLVAAASLIQLTSGLLGLLLYLLHDLRLRSFVYAVLFGAVVLLGFSDYLLIKLLANEVLQKPGTFSGLAPLGLTWSLLLIWSSDQQARHSAVSKIALLLLLSVASYAIAQITYAGLRLQLLIVFLCCLALAAHLRQHRLALARRSALAILIIGILFGALKLRNIAQSDEDTEAPFVPYKFYWEKM